jgi:hypothetical protein
MPPEAEGMRGIDREITKKRERHERRTRGAVKEEIKKEVEEALGKIPKGHASDLVVKETIRCVLYGFLREQGGADADPCLSESALS